MSDDLAEIKRTAVQRPHDVQAQIAAAYAHDRAGDEAAAIRYYDAAFALGIPSTEVRGFLVGYGSTLRNVGRADEAVAILAQAIADDPAYPPFHAFLSLALFAAGHPRAALATMLGCALDLSHGAFEGYERALGAYHRELLSSTI